MLTPEIIAVLGILVFAVTLFVFEVVRVDVAALIVLVILGLSSQIEMFNGGLVPIYQLFDGFSSNAVMSIIAVMIIGAGLDKTGVMGVMAAQILKRAGKTEGRITLVLSACVAWISSFMQNIGAAALFLPVASRISRRTAIPLSRLLMPMGFCAILGGTMTMVGSSPLILLNDLLESANLHFPDNAIPMEKFGLFAVAPVGVALVITGVLYFLIFGKRILPVAEKQALTTENLQHYRDVYGIDGRIFEVTVKEDSDLAGLRLGEVQARGRSGWILGIKTGTNVQIIPAQDTLIEAGSMLAIMGARVEVSSYAEEHSLIVSPFLNEFADALNPTTAGIAELVIPPDSDLIGSSISKADIRKRYGMRVLTVYRIDTVIDDDLSSLRLQAGDTLVVHSRWQDMINVSKDKRFAVVTDFPKEEFRTNKLRNASIAFAIAISLVLFSDLPLSLSLMVGAVGMVIGKVLNMEEAYEAVSWQTVFLLACLIPLGMAMQQSGAAAFLADLALTFMDGFPVWGIQLFLAIIATVFTLVMSNVGATVLLVPLAIQMALGVGADPAIFALTVALATSNSFLIPTHQVNALIMGPAGYSVKDFLKAGFGMTTLFLLVMLLVLNIFY
ncbi:SLC13 family permease [Arenicella sp. 4NH20-0111]|uniref:SLC13 family permease n=1 Tax=Arenicella sp. 4NH20-0111 TaxID=3127648 RepID=UPI003104464E